MEYEIIPIILQAKFDYGLSFHPIGDRSIFLLFMWSHATFQPMEAAAFLSPVK